MKGIVLAGGSGSRLWPITQVVSKQLLPIYDKPLIYYPLSTLMLAGIRELLLITTPKDQNLFMELLGDGSRFGISISYEIQNEPRGLAQAFTIGAKFIDGDCSALILGDNIFYGAGLQSLVDTRKFSQGSHIFIYEVSNPSAYGVLELNSNGLPISIVEKPKNPKSKLAITGLYFFENSVIEIVKNIEPSERGELEITSLIDFYRSKELLSYSRLSRGIAWLDTGTPNSMNEASQFVRVIEERTGTKIGCLEEIAWRNGWINDSELYRQSKAMRNNDYGRYLANLLEN